MQYLEWNLGVRISQQIQANPIGISLGGFLFFIVLAITGFSGCRLPSLYVGDGLGILSVTVASDETFGTKSLAPASYRVSGNGPEGDSFSLDMEGNIIRVDDLTTGEWAIMVDGLDSDGNLLLSGESSVRVEAYGVSEADIFLIPASGLGNASLSVSWNADHTVAPSVVAVFTDTEGNESVYNLPITAAGTASGLVSNLATGTYYLTLQLIDSGATVMGSAWTVKILNGQTVEISTLFPDINKVGQKISIFEEEFTIAWDVDSDDNPDQFRMYFRHRGEESWTILSEIAAEPEPRFQVNSALLSAGTYEFAVSAVAGGEESALHTSMDDTADPESGWYVDWYYL